MAGAATERFKTAGEGEHVIPKTRRTRARLTIEPHALHLDPQLLLGSSRIAQSPTISKFCCIGQHPEFCEFRVGVREKCFVQRSSAAASILKWARKRRLQARQRNALSGQHGAEHLVPESRTLGRFRVEPRLRMAAATCRIWATSWTPQNSVYSILAVFPGSRSIGQRRLWFLYGDHRYGRTPVGPALVFRTLGWCCSRAIALPPKGPVDVPSAPRLKDVGPFCGTPFAELASDARTKHFGRSVAIDPAGWPAGSLADRELGRVAGCREPTTRERICVSGPDVNLELAE